MGQKSNSHLCVRVQAEGSSRLVKSGKEFVYLPLESTYSVKICNTGKTRCDVNVSISGMDLGTWRIPAKDHLIVTEYADTGVKLRTFEGREVLTVSFRPERVSEGVTKQWQDTEQATCCGVVVKRPDGRTYLVPALSNSRVDWSKADEVIIRLMVG